MRADTPPPSIVVTRMFASLVTIRSLGEPSTLKVLFHSSVEPDGRTDSTNMKTLRIMSHLHNCRLPIDDCRIRLPVCRAGTSRSDGTLVDAPIDKTQLVAPSDARTLINSQTNRPQSP